MTKSKFKTIFIEYLKLEQYCFPIFKLQYEQIQINKVKTTKKQF